MKAKKDKKSHGRPLKFKSPEELQAKINQHFKDCDSKDPKIPYTITGLALALNTSRETLMDYEHSSDPAFSDTVKKAKLKCHNYAENHLFTGRQVAGAIFNLKNNWGWTDKTEQDINLTGNLSEMSEDELDKLIQDELKKLGGEE